MMKDHDMMMMKDHDMMMMKEPARAAAPAPQPAPAAAPHEPMYLGTFDKARNMVEGDVFMLDERTLYIQGFSFDGQAPDVFFWSDGVAIPYYTRFVDVVVDVAVVVVSPLLYEFTKSSLGKKQICCCCFCCCCCCL